jgi:hypothetical protein
VLKRFDDTMEISKNAKSSYHYSLI